MWWVAINGGCNGSGDVVYGGGWSVEGRKEKKRKREKE